MTERKIILAVDDMQENLTLLRSLLKELFDVRLAKSAKLALQLLENTRVDLILLDIEMPAMSGIEFMKRLRQNYTPNRATPVICVTSHANSEIIEEAVNSGARDYVVKPIKAEILFKKIKAAIGLPTERTTPHPMEIKVESLLGAARSGDITLSETILEELSRLSQNDPVCNHYVEQIEKFIKAFDFEKGIKDITEFLDYLSFNRMKIRS